MWVISRLITVSWLGKHPTHLSPPRFHRAAGWEVEKCPQVPSLLCRALVALLQSPGTPSLGHGLGINRSGESLSSCCSSDLREIPGGASGPDPALRASPWKGWGSCDLSVASTVFPTAGGKLEKAAAVKDGPGTSPASCGSSTSLC